MKKILLAISLQLSAISLFAQTLNVQVGNVTYQFPAAQADVMNYSNGTTLTVMGKVFTLSEVDAMYVDETAVTNNLVGIVYSGSSAAVTVAGNVAQYVSATLNGAHVSIAQTNTAAVDGDEITYQLSGSSTNGSFELSGAYKSTIALAGLTLTNPNGAAINITNSKRIQLSAKNGTTNTLTDCASGSQKACIYSKGQLQLQGNGTLNVAGNTKHGIKSASYISVKNLTLNITSTVGDGINCEEYMEIKSGTITLSGIGDDGIQCDLGGTSSTGITTDHEDEDTGNIYISGGTLSVAVSAAAAKGIKSDGDMYITAGTITSTTSGGGAWDTDALKVKSSAGLNADGNMVVSGGTLLLTSTGAGGKGISADGTLAISDSTLITIATSGQAVVASSSGSLSTVSNASSLDRYSTNYKSSPKGIKIDGAVSITGGKVSVTTTGAGGEGIESKSTLNISGGEITVNAYDDAINSASHMTIEGGMVYARATNNDGLDANGNCYIKGGLVYAVGASSPEVAIDANTEGGYKLYVSGGTIVAIGGLESGSSLTQSCYSAGSSSSGGGGGRPGGGGGGGGSSSSWSKNTWYALTVGSTVFAFKTPSSGGTALVVSGASTPTLTSGVTASGTAVFEGVGYYPASVSGGSSVTLSSYSGGNSGGGPGGW